MLQWPIRTEVHPYTFQGPLIMTRDVLSFPARVFLTAFFLVLTGAFGWAQHGLSRLDRDRAQAMLETVASDVRHNYYDANLHGVNWDARVKQAKDAIAKANTLDDATMQIAGLLESLNDSHTQFFPPRYSMAAEYGWNFQMIGRRCFITRVQPGSDAEAKGVHPGDELTMLDGFQPTRESAFKLVNALNLSPQRTLQLGLVDPTTRKFRMVEVNSKLERAQVVRGYWEMRNILENEDAREHLKTSWMEFGPELMIVKFPAFIQSGAFIEEMQEKARQHKTLIIDLRGNGGGNEAVLKEWLSGVFENEVKIADRVKRGKAEPLIAKGSKHRAFTGKLIVLVDSHSASAAELFARVVQLEKRGTIVGDLSSGATMEAEIFPHISAVIFATEITRANLIMKDGHSIEHIGVTPDEVILPTALDLANGRDPVLSRAAAMAGVTLTPERAFQMFPYEWPKSWIYRY